MSLTTRNGIPLVLFADRVADRIHNIIETGDDDDGMNPSISEVIHAAMKEVEKAERRRCTEVLKGVQDEYKRQEDLGRTHKNTEVIHNCVMFGTGFKWAAARINEPGWVSIPEGTVIP